MKTVSVAFILCLLSTAPALAHKVNVYAVAGGGVVSGEGYFSDGVKAQNAQVRIFNAKGAVVARTSTKTDGTFEIALPPDASPPLRVVLTASEGHQNDYTLTDLGADTESKSEPAQPAAQDATPANATAAPDESRLSALVEAAVGKAVEERLTPMRLELAKMAAQNDGAKMRDIVGGLGWIIGLVGLAAWFKRPGKKD